MNKEQVTIPLPVDTSECDQEKAAECGKGDFDVRLSSNDVEVAAKSPDCATFIPLWVAGGLTKGFLWLHQRKNSIARERAVIQSKEQL